MNLIQELADLVAAFDAEQIPYALCGGLAMAIHAHPRATIDIDVLLPAQSLAAAKAAAGKAGFDIEAKPMLFAQGKVPIHRVSKIVAGQILSLDMLVASEATQQAWDSREKVQWKAGTLWVVSREGLILLKKLRGSGQDQDDIKRLEDH